jgi:hypothetical protein
MSHLLGNDEQCGRLFGGTTDDESGQADGLRLGSRSVRPSTSAQAPTLRANGDVSGNAPAQGERYSCFSGETGEGSGNVRSHYFMPRISETLLPLAGEGARRRMRAHLPCFKKRPHPSPLPQAGEGAVVCEWGGSGFPTSSERWPLRAICPPRSYPQRAVIPKKGNAVPARKRGTGTAYLGHGASPRKRRCTVPLTGRYRNRRQPTDRRC